MSRPMECEVVRVYFNSTNIATGRFELLMSPMELHEEAWRKREPLGENVCVNSPEEELEWKPVVSAPELDAHDFVSKAELMRMNKLHNQRSEPKPRRKQHS